jgi:hypothetical protein
MKAVGIFSFPFLFRPFPSDKGWGRLLGRGQAIERGPYPTNKQKNGQCSSNMTWPESIEQTDHTKLTSSISNLRSKPWLNGSHNASGANGERQEIWATYSLNNEQHLLDTEGAVALLALRREEPLGYTEVIDAMLSKTAKTSVKVKLSLRQLHAKLTCSGRRGRVPT